MRPLCIDLFCGLGGWTEGFLAEGYQCIGFDIEQHRYPRMVSTEKSVKNHNGGSWFNIGRPGQIKVNDNPVNIPKCAVVEGEWQQYPGELVLQDIRTLHGSQFRKAAVIVASPPCQEYSYMAMPWSRSKQIQRALLGQDDFPANYNGGSRTIAKLNELFDACSRIQREASEAAGHHIPMVVENVQGAQRWVGRAKWSYGSYYLWGDVPAIMPFTRILPDKQPIWFNYDLKRTGVKHQPACPEATGWFGKWTPGGADLMRNTSSKSPARKAASAQIAMIPYELSRHIAKVYCP